MIPDASPQPGAARPRRHRRVQRAGAEGSDPTPALPGASEDRTGPDTDSTPSFGSNDDRLRRDVPPHW